MINHWQLQQVACVVRQGGIIAYPTEGVWGLGCNPWCEEAVLDVLSIKNRPLNKGIILIAGAMEQFDFLLNDLPLPLLEKLQKTWPGPFTWLIPHQNRIPYWITGTHTTVALRVSNHPLVKAVCNLTGPLISTSANPAGLPAARSRLMVEKYFHKMPISIVNGVLGGAKIPSQIRDLITDKIYR